MTASGEWGRISEDGTAYVKTGDGERIVGSWHAGSADEGLAFFTRKYDDLAAEIAILEGRIGSPAADAKAVAAAARKVRTGLASAAVIGDLELLDTRLQRVLDRAEAKRAAHAEERAAAAEKATEAKRTLVEEAERLAARDDWRATGERFRALVEEWKGIHGVDRRTDSELWERLSTARRDFDKRRRTHFADVERERGLVAEHKERLIAEADKLADSTEWTSTARRFKDLMAEWKAAGRAGREVEEALWVRFKAAQDAFFARRSEAFAARDQEYRGNVEAKEALLTEAERLDPRHDPEAARKRLRSIHERWEAVGRVPREQTHALEERLAAVEQRVRDAASTTRRVAVSESPLVVRLRESVEKLEGRLRRAHEAGDARLAAETEQSLATQREWLARAEQSD
jgi:Domain of Unknown Function (DUF349)